MRIVAIYQCLFFTVDHIDYWENIESNSDGEIKALLNQRLAAGNWQAAEAWLQDVQVCRIAALESHRADARLRTGNGEDSPPEQAGSRVDDGDN
jgi:hypothetical protein